MADKPLVTDPASTEENPPTVSKAEPAVEVATDSVIKSEDKFAPSAPPDPSEPPAQPKTTLPLSVDLLRHGQVATPSMFSAPSGEPLGMAGWKQLTLATQNTHWDVIIAPPTRRCHDFARLLAQRLSCEFRVDERFCEMNFGDWVGLSQQEIIARDPELLQQYYFQPRRFHAPRGESMELFMMRVHQGWEELLTSCAEQRVLILTHTGVIRVILGKALDLLYQKTLRFEVDYARFSRLSFYPDGEIVLSGHGLATV